ncbi:hypothetical protein RhiirC2_335964 [Rhizophagus irregularis]|uniref:Uncharacterized protein n=1 Tax=Rhizophagus irregularis TaxID=588596 RepID=A0A2N1NHV6_9GLOM|nr:hypothetical protein RhiirC2_335964 [Rhizophagus irregularis]
MEVEKLFFFFCNGQSNFFSLRLFNFNFNFILLFHVHCNCTFIFFFCTLLGMLIEGMNSLRCCIYIFYIPFFF